ncbi:hypothetical protein Hrd1104_00235 [Halorhabdus sp. CBA1104]|uniref:hypothetical protein n=1 Tax=Halorhabdus sp. CBA1104 TaxID=1380432 RepID=UPI0012B3D5AD|nr:hypothetical protein [Halorhabdus sp. CBA1104]QGN05871.1 hypothetical protein Hrd1104_00235 [Halorhabdus sp. CBA1104]
MGDAVAELLDKIADTWDQDDPRVLLFEDENRSCVADVDGELRLLSSGLVYARRLEETDVRVAADRHGIPEVVPLSAERHRFEKRHFEDVADVEEGAVA